MFVFLYLSRAVGSVPVFLVGTVTGGFGYLYIWARFFRLVTHFERHGAVKDSEQCS